MALSEMKGDYEKALSYCFAALQSAAYLQANKDEQVEYLQGVIADLYKQTGKLKEAVGKLKEVIELNMANKGDPSSLLYYYNNLGAVYHRMANDKQAISAFRNVYQYKILRARSTAGALSVEHFALTFS